MTDEAEMREAFENTGMFNTMPTYEEIAFKGYVEGSKSATAQSQQRIAELEAKLAAAEESWQQQKRCARIGLKVSAATGLRRKLHSAHSINSGKNLMQSTKRALFSASMNSRQQQIRCTIASQKSRRKKKY